MVVLEYLFVKFRPDEVDMYAEGARQLWFKRNKVVHGGDFAHPNDLILIAKNHIADYKAAMQPVTLVHDAEATSDSAEEIMWKSPPPDTIRQIGILPLMKIMVGWVMEVLCMIFK